MKKVISLIVLASILMGLSACKKDDNTDLPDNNDEVTVTIVGQVTNEAGLPLQGVVLKTATYTKVSNGYGEFVFENVKVPATRLYVKATQAGYMPAGAGAIGKDGGTVYLKIKMLSLGTPQLVSVSSGGSVTTNNGAKMTIPAMGLSYADGSVFTGTARVYTRYISPALSNFSEIVPGGDLTALSAGNLATLYSYGMLGAELQDNAGLPLKVANGAKVEVRMPIASAQLSTAPATIPLLHFDEEKGLWVEEGSATKVGNEYVGQVSHFSWWNCDIIFSPPTTITGRVVDCNGIPIAGAVVNFNNQYTLVTNGNGIYSNYIPVGIPLTITVSSSQNSNMYAAANPVQLTTISGVNQAPDLVLSCPATITGSVKDCNGNPTSGYVRIVYPNGGSVLYLTGNGTFSIPVPMFSNLSIRVFNSQATIDTIGSSAGSGSAVNVGSFTLCGPGGGSCADGTSTVNDIDGNIYHVVAIGGQCWLLENLKTTRYRNGDAITTGLSDNQWNTTSSGAYAYYNNDSTFNGQYGKLYNFYAVADPRNIAPTGWHVATDADWTQLVNYLGNSTVAGGKLKAAGTLQNANGIWEAPNTGADNSTGFTALPAGYRNYDGTYSGIGSYAYFFTANASTANTAWFYLMNNIAPDAYRNDNNKNIGLSVRCVKD